MSLPIMASLRRYMFKLKMLLKRNLSVKIYIAIFVLFCLIFFAKRDSSAPENCAEGETSQDCPAPCWYGAEFKIPKVLIEPICEDFKTPVLFYVYSKFSNEKRRKLFRSRFYKYFDVKNTKVSLIFLLGQPESKDMSIQKYFDIEVDVHEDILQIDMIDTYNDLGYKSIGFFNWLQQCKAPDKQILVKLDDDINNTMPRMFALAEDIIGSQRALDNTILCYFVNYNVLANEEKLKDRWGTTRQHYPESKFPPYCSGNNGFYFTVETASRLLAAAARDKGVYHIDDVYITGLLRQKACLFIDAYEWDSFSDRFSNAWDRTWKVIRKTFG